jgi:beta-lactamase regulating signal transducer with metallopeptidase domain
VDNALAAAPFIQSIGWTLVHFLWQGTVIAGGVAAALRGLAGAASTTRYAVACGGLALMLAAPVVTFVSLSDQTAEARANAASSSDVPTVVAASAAEGSAMPVELGSTPALQLPTFRVETLLPVTVAVWMAGVLLFSVRLVVSSLAVERLKRTGTQDVDDRVVVLLSTLSRRLGLGRSVRVLQSAIVNVPTVVGCLRPVILLPASVVSGLPIAHLEAVIAHELAHVRRHDYLVNLGQATIETLLFYHPAVWWCSRQIRIEREHCCDDIVVHACGDRLAYITALTDLEDLRRPRTALALSASGGRLIDRVRRLLTSRPAQQGSRAWVLVSALAVTLVLVLSASTYSYMGVDPAVAPDPQVPAPAPPAVPSSPVPPPAPAPRAVPSLVVPPATLAPRALPAPVPPQVPAPPAVPLVVPPLRPAPLALPAPVPSQVPAPPAAPLVVPPPRPAPLAPVALPPVAPQVPAPPAAPLVVPPPRSAPPAPVALPPVAPPQVPAPPAPQPGPVADSDIGRQRLRAELAALELTLAKLGVDLRQVAVQLDRRARSRQVDELAKLRESLEALRKQLDAIQAR